ncbi:DUF4097 family beta strand repeat-containing protein [Kurthia sibirica]|uniref:Uncharacterized protein n=1 Tax=Kurthia sibirica TaxID=202750 RepID=A0A2U3AMT1_9BACL|nr:DUF4097 family beta strand repeat-containing protein [Kurthia sibirica]PWI25821.1 hypothetical protein DEX24_06355 [Kurthia sibirica]GEK33639.1 hypothetical protein KSI01_11720 [Kurthia sibirica]
MQNERSRILKLVENGTISAEEAIVLLEKLERGPDKVESNNNENDQQQEQQQSHDNESESFEEEKKHSKEEEFVEDLKRDFGQFSNRLMDFLGTAVNKVKDMDFSSMTSGGEKIEWTDHLGEETVRSISADIPNGQLTVRDSIDGSTTIEVSAASMIGFSTSNFTEEDLKKQFRAFNDNGTLRIVSTSKTVKIDVKLFLPKGDYKDLKAGLFNGNFSVQSLNIGRIRVQTKNGNIDMSDVNFDTAEVESSNGSIEIREVAGKELEAETMNGRVYVDGALRSIEAKSMNGHIILTTRSQEAERIKAHTTAGSIELYIPNTISLSGEVVSSFGKMDVDLKDVELLHETDKMFNKSLRFNKTIADAQRLNIDGETTTGSVIIRYTL